ncbi:MAG TPA: DNA-processing protein DprA [Desulfuromonadales bacterium]|nr:DNA-processing protein DprA [Desulfuromonadales bacterium]
MNDVLPWLRLHLTPGLGRAALYHLINHFGDPQTALAQIGDWPPFPGLRSGLAARVPAADDRQLAEACRRLKACGARIMTFLDADFPPLLGRIPDPPAILYVLGSLEPAGRRLAVVGSRRPTHTGLRWTEELASELSRQGVTVVSGLARGIDAAAHRGGLAGAGGTIAVLGCGIDCIYPPEHKDLFREIAELGTVISEYPPGTEPLPGHFPGRNRIISGLSQGVLVVEAARGSGSLITADFALEQGREVLAVPGGIDRPTSQGTNRLIKEGAHPVTEAADILGTLWPDVSAPTSWPFDQAEQLADLPEPARTVFEMLNREPRNIDELAGECGLTPMEVSAILLHLELQGRAESLPGARYIRSDGACFQHSPWGTD